MSKPPSIDDILHPVEPTAAETVEAFMFVATLGQAIAEAGEHGIPSGHLYAMVMDLVSLQLYERALGILKRTGIVTEENRILKINVKGT